MSHCIIFGIDNNYVNHLVTSLNSIFQNSDSQDFHIYILSLNVEKENKTKISQWAQSYCCDLEFIDIDKDVVKNFPIKTDGSISLATYLRLFIPDILPQHITKALYIDSDTLVLTDLKKIFAYDLSNKAAAAVQDITNKNFIQTKSETYYNAGVFLLNISYLRETNFTARALSFIQNNTNPLNFHDQDVLNALLDGMILTLPLEWNLLDCFFQEPPFIQENRKLLLNKAKEHPAIIHFSGLIKPWHFGCLHPFTKKYQKYILDLNLNCPNDKWSHFSRIPRYQKILILLRVPRKIYFKIERVLIRIWNITHA